MNYIWFLLIAVSVIVGAFNGKLDAVTAAVFEGAQRAVQVAIYLIGIMAFWLGMVKIAEKSGIVDVIAKIVNPIAEKIFPEIAKNKEAIGNITLNFSANALGLANAATPIGIKAMEEMQKVNTEKNSASNPMCTFLAMNTAGFQLIPTTVIAILAAQGAKNPTQIIIPTLIVTSFTFIGAIIIVKLLEKISPPQGVQSND